MPLFNLLRSAQISRHARLAADQALEPEVARRVPTSKAELATLAEDAANAVTLHVVPPEVVEQMDEALLHYLEHGGDMMALAPTQWRAFRGLQERSLNALKALHHRINPRAPFESGQFGGLAHRLGFERSALSNLACLGKDLPYLYSAGCSDLQKIHVTLNVATQHAGLLHPLEWNAIDTAIRNLEASVAPCGPAIAQHLENTYKAVRQILSPSGLNELFDAKRVQVIEQMLLEYVRTRTPSLLDQVGNEIHVVAALRNHFASQLNIPAIQDRYIANYVLALMSTHELRVLQENIENRVIRPALALSIASDLLDEAQGQLDVRRAEPKPAQSESQCIDAFVAEVTRRLGPLDESCFKTLNSNYEVQLIKNPTLLGAALLQKMNLNTFNERKPSEMVWHEDGQYRKVLVADQHLTYFKIERGQEVGIEPVTLEDLNAAPLLNLVNVHCQHHAVVCVLSEAFRNSDTPTLQHFGTRAWDELPVEQRLALLWMGLNVVGEHDAHIESLRSRLGNRLEQPELYEVLNSPIANHLPTQAIAAALSRDYQRNKPSSPSKFNCSGTLLHLILRGDPRTKQTKAPIPLPVYREACLLAVQLGLDIGHPALTHALYELTPQHLDCLKQCLAQADEDYLRARLAVAATQKGVCLTNLNWALSQLPKLEESNLLMQVDLGKLLQVADRPKKDTVQLLCGLLNKGMVRQPTTPVAVQAIRLLFDVGKAEHLAMLLDLLPPENKSNVVSEALESEVKVSRELMDADLQVAVRLLEVVCQHGVDLHRAGPRLLAIGVALNNIPFVQKLLHHNVNANARLVGKASPLYQALDQSHLEVARLLLKHGADPFKAFNGSNSVDLALKLRAVDLAVAMYATQGKALNALNKKEYTPLQEVLVRAEAFGLIRQHGIPDPEHEATLQGLLLHAKVLLMAGSDPNTRSGPSHFGKTALHMAYRANLTEFANLLLEYGANPNARDYKFRTPGSLR